MLYTQYSGVIWIYGLTWPWWKIDENWNIWMMTQQRLEWGLLIMVDSMCTKNSDTVWFCSTPVSFCTWRLSNLLNKRKLETDTGLVHFWLKIYKHIISTQAFTIIKQTKFPYMGSLWARRRWTNKTEGEKWMKNEKELLIIKEEMRKYRIGSRNLMLTCSFLAFSIKWQPSSF